MSRRVSRTEAAPSSPVDRKPAADLAPVSSDNLSVTKGELAGTVIEVPTMRGFARGAGGDSAQLTFTYRGESKDSRALANGDVRRQLGLKLRAQNSCNVIYVMWRLDPRPEIDVSVKINPGLTSHKQCGAEGYAKVKSRTKQFVSAYEFGTTHTLRAEIVGDDLYAWVDDKLAFDGQLPEAARTLAGPAGIRSDNVAFELVELAAPSSLAPAETKPAVSQDRRLGRCNLRRRAKEAMQAGTLIRVRRMVAVRALARALAIDREPRRSSRLLRPPIRRT